MFNHTVISWYNPKKSALAKHLSSLVYVMFPLQLNMGLVRENPSTAVQRRQAEEQDDLCYASVSFSKNREDPLYSNISPAQVNRHKNEEEEEDNSVEYTAVNCE